MADKQVLVQFLQPYLAYNVDEVAGFPEAEAIAIVKRGIAKEVKAKA